MNLMLLEIVWGYKNDLSFFFLVFIPNIDNINYKKEKTNYINIASMKIRDISSDLEGTIDISLENMKINKIAFRL